jgi:hypothetical protein
MPHSWPGILQKDEISFRAMENDFFFRFANWPAVPHEEDNLQMISG